MRLCVFCGPREGSDPVYREAATLLAQLLAQEGVGLVYAGGRVGLMGTIADAALSRGGEAIGVHPGALVDIAVAQRG